MGDFRGVLMLGIVPGLRVKLGGCRARGRLVADINVKVEGALVV